MMGKGRFFYYTKRYVKHSDITDKAKEKSDKPEEIFVIKITVKGANSLAATINQGEKE